jgi:hypothetical protein
MKLVTRRWVLTTARASLAALFWRNVPRGGNPQLLRSYVESEYDTRHLVNVRGWLVSATEAQLWES